MLEWPDALANEADVGASQPRAVALVEALRTGDRQSFLKAVEQDPDAERSRPERLHAVSTPSSTSDAATLKRPAEGRECKRAQRC